MATKKLTLPVVSLELKKTTTGAYQFKEPESPDKKWLDTLYIKQFAFAERGIGQPKSIKVTIEVEF